MKITREIPDVYRAEVVHYTDNGFDEFVLQDLASSGDGVVVWRGTVALVDGEVVTHKLTDHHEELLAAVPRCRRCNRVVPQYMTCNCTQVQNNIVTPITKPKPGASKK